MTTLAVGSHRRDDGARCLMEHVSELAGGEFGLLPRGTHPVLAALAVRVNDTVSDDGRTALLRRAPALVGATDADPALGWAIVECCAAADLRLRPADPGARRRLVRARRRRRTWAVVLPRAVAVRLPRWLPVACAVAALDEVLAAVAVLVRVTAACSLDPAQRDATLLRLLDDALALVGRDLGGDGAVTLGSSAAPVGG